MIDVIMVFGFLASVVWFISWLGETAYNYAINKGDDHNA